MTNVVLEHMALNSVKFAYIGAGYMLFTKINVNH